MTRGRRLLVVLALLGGTAGGAGTAGAQVRPGAAAEFVTDALDLERDERYPEAAESYRAALRIEPANISALLGLERVLKALSQTATIFPQLQRALSRDARNPLLRAIELRSWLTLKNNDSVSASAQRWINVAPESPEPYREWASDLTTAGRLDEAGKVLEQGTAKLGTDPFLADLAMLSAARGNWVESARQWHAAVLASAPSADPASENLSMAPAAARPQVLALLRTTLPDATARRLAADLDQERGNPK